MLHVELRLALRERLDRLDIRAPRSGTLLGLTVFTERAVIRPAEPVMYVVPDETSLVVDASIEPTNINQIFHGEDAWMRFSAMNARKTTEIDGLLNRVSPEPLTNEQTGQRYHSAKAAIGEEGLTRLDELTLVTGMPVEVYLQTGERSPLSYFTRPFTDCFNRSTCEN